MTPKQEQLKQIHGTPEEFRAALTRALGDVTIDKANAALERYQADWDAAGAADPGEQPPPISEADIQWKRFEKLYSLKYGWTPHPNDSSTRSALAWFKAGLAYIAPTPAAPTSKPLLLPETRKLFTDVCRQLFVLLDKRQRAEFIEELTQEHQRLCRITRNSGPRPSMNDFVFIEDGVPFRVSKLDSGWWIMVWHADKKWVLSRSIHETDVHFYYEKAIPLEQAKLYEAGVPFEPADASAPPPEPPSDDQPAPASPSEGQ